MVLSSLVPPSTFIFDSNSSQFLAVSFWISSNDEPLVSVQGTDDLTVNYNCGPGQNIASVLTLCGSGEMHPRADAVGLFNDKLIFSGEGHNWAAYGNSEPLFLQALDFTSAFLFPLLPCNNTTAINELFLEKQLIKIVDVLGKETVQQKNTPQFYIYNDGTVEKKYIH